MRSPLAPSVFLLRNASKTLPLIGVIVLAVLLVMGIVTMMNSIPLSIRTTYEYSKSFVAVTPRGDPTRSDAIRDKFIKDSPIEIGRIITCRAIGAQVNSIVGKWDFAIFGLNPEDTKFFMDSMNTVSLEGRLPKPGAPECLVSEPVARNLKLKLGSSLLKPDDQELYSPYPVKVVGIAKTHRWYMIADIDYMKTNHFPPLDNVLVFAKNPTDQPSLDTWALSAFKGERAFVFAFGSLEAQTADMFRILYGILDVVIFMLVIVITLMMGMLMNIYQAQRLVEFGLLQAIGFTKKQLLRRVMLETTLVLIFGWILGVFAGLALLSVVKQSMFDPNGFALEPVDFVALRYTVPIPVAIALVATISFILRFRKFDPVGIVERRLL